MCGTPHLSTVTSTGFSKPGTGYVVSLDAPAVGAIVEAASATTIARDFFQCARGRIKYPRFQQRTTVGIVPEPEEFFQGAKLVIEVCVKIG